jgi:multiple sugar transport system substrate-binding protein
MKGNGKNLNRRDFLRLSALTAASSALVASCTPAPGPAQEAAPTEQAAQQATAAVPAQEPITVSWWDSSLSEDEFRTIDPTVKKFSELHPELPVEISHGADGTKFLTAVSGGTPPNVYWTYENWNYGSWINKGIVQSLDPFIQSGGMDLKRYLPTAIQSMTWQDKVYGMPLTGGASMTFWNKKAYADAGLNPEAGPATLDEMQAASDKLLKKDEQGNILVGPALISWHITDLATNFGNHFWDPAAEKLTCTDQAMVDSFNWAASFYKHFGADALDRFNSSLGEYNSPSNPFCMGNIPLTIDGEWLALVIRSRCPDTQFAFGEFPKATPQSGPLHPVQGALPVLLPTGAKNPNESWMLIDYIMSTPASAAMSVGLVCNCMVADAVNDKAYAADPVLMFALQYYQKDAEAFPMTLPVAGEYSTELSKAWDLVVHGSQTAEIALQEVYDRVQPALDTALGKS